MIWFLIILAIGGLLLIAARQQRKSIAEFDALTTAEKVIRKADRTTSKMPEASKEYSPLVMDHGNTYVFHDKSIAAFYKKEGWVAEKSTVGEDALLTLFDNDLLRNDEEDTVQLLLSLEQGAVRKGATVVSYSDGTGLYFDRKSRFWIIDDGNP